MVHIQAIPAGKPVKPTHPTYLDDWGQRNDPLKASQPSRQAGWYLWEGAWLRRCTGEIADDLRQKIKTDELTPGSQLPTENDLQQQYNASRNTVRDAIKWLITRGLVETRPGQGTFVTERITPFITPLTGDPGSN